MRGPRSSPWNWFGDIETWDDKLKRRFWNHQRWVGKNTVQKMMWLFMNDEAKKKPHWVANIPFQDSKTSNLERPGYRYKKVIYAIQHGAHKLGHWQSQSQKSMNQQDSCHIHRWTLKDWLEQEVICAIQHGAHNWVIDKVNHRWLRINRIHATYIRGLWRK